MPTCTSSRKFNNVFFVRSHFRRSPASETRSLLPARGLNPRLFAQWEGSRDGRLPDTFENYRSLEEFEELFRERFRAFLATQTQEEIGRSALSQRVGRWKSSPPERKRVTRPLRGHQITDESKVFDNRSSSIKRIRLEGKAYS